MKAEQVTILDGSTFVVSDLRGDVDAGPAQVEGLFYRDTRHLSTWRLLLDGRPLEALASDLVAYDSAAFFLVVPTGTVYVSPTLSLVRRRTVGDGLREELSVRNSSSERRSVSLMMVFGADFADVFEVKDAEAKKGNLQVTTEEHTAVLEYTRGDFVRHTAITAEGAAFSRGSLTYSLVLEPEQVWTKEIIVDVGDHPSAAHAKPRPVRSAPAPNMRANLADWVAAAPSMECDSDTLRHVYERSITDLAALRFYPDVETDTDSLPAAGLPWFMALFGRDSLLTSYQALPFLPELAGTTLRALAARQAVEEDDFRDAEPGKILHELRFGELTHFKERPQSPYYGSADATPLFLILLDEYHRWTGDDALVRSLEPSARAAVQWLQTYGDRDGDGYLEYERRNQKLGLENQCWKDSWNSIVHPDGSLASLPRATCELQGYAYDARCRTARLAREVWRDEAWAGELDNAAAELKRRFNDDFWLADAQYFALALDGRKERVRTITSNPGHLLWSGIVDESRLEGVTRRLMSDELFSGWGVRTLATGQAAFNPLEYHNGTVWPHDNSLIAAGLARYGKHQEAGRIAQATLDAAGSFDYRLPETFAGYARADTGFPVPYPSACSPQAWASATPLLLLTVLLGLTPDIRPGAGHETHVPRAMGRICLSGVHTPSGPVTVDSGR